MEVGKRISQLLEQSGAVAFGWTEAAPVPDEEWERFESWIAKGYHAGMRYMENYPDIRKDPRLLLPGARTIVSVAFNYRQPNPYRGLATYALGQDYHKVLRRRLQKVISSMKSEFGGGWRVCIDSAPILERYWAQRCGIGYRSPLHGNIIVPGIGSMVFLAEILTTLEFEPEWSEFGVGIGIREQVHMVTHRHSGSGGVTGAESQTSQYTSHCPTGALQPGGVVDARRCINYLTIEHKGELDDEQKALVGSAFFGCDICQLSCPSNQGPYPAILSEFSPLPGLEDLIDGKESNFDLKSSAISRRPGSLL